jgi:hypothetical protein
MSMEHKAFVFDYKAFAKELKPLLEKALTNSDNKELIQFIEENREALKDPDTGEPLEEDWQDQVEDDDPHRYGDLALTRYYDPEDGIGLAYDWMDLDDELQAELGNDRAVALGDPCGPKDNHFDPGKMGSYFQSPDKVKKNLTLLGTRLKKKTPHAQALKRVRDMLQPAADAGKGMYVTF